MVGRLRGDSLDLTIGDLVPLTGDLADYGPPGEKAANLAVDQINAAIRRPAPTTRSSSSTEDDQTTDAGRRPGRAQAGRSDGASCIAGAGPRRTRSRSRSSVTIPEGVLQISPASTADEITGLDDDGLVNRTAPPDSFQGPTLADAIERMLGGAKGKTINIGARNDAYGTGFADTFTEAWEAQGGTIGQKVIYDPEQPDATTPRRSRSRRATPTQS